MFIKKEFLKWAVQNIFRYKSRNILTGLSITIGTLSLVLGLSFTNGIIKQTIFGFTGTIVEDVMVFPHNNPISDREKNKKDNTFDTSMRRDALMLTDLLFRNKDPKLNNYKEIIKSLSQIKGIDYITKKVQFFGYIYSEKSRVNTMVIGMEPEGIRRKENLAIYKGRYLEENDIMFIMISKKLANRLQVDVGDRIAIVANMPEGGTNAKDFQIAGIFDIKTGFEIVNHLTYISLPDAQNMMGLNDTQVFSLGIYLHDVDAVDSYLQRIREKVKNDNLLGSVYSWKQILKGLIAQYLLIKYIVLIFNIVLLIIITVGVVNSVFLSISERTREIGTIMAMGATKKQIIKLYLLEGMIINISATILGGILGTIITLLFQKFGFEAPTSAASLLFGGRRLYPDFDIITLLFVFCFVILLTFIGVLYPIRKASKMTPMEALGYV